MSESQTANLAEPVSEQLSGIVLVWRQYDSSQSSAVAGSAVYQHIPKAAVEKYPGMGAGVILQSATGNVLGVKYVYISDGTVTGNANNDSSEYTSSAGVKFTPRSWVLTDIYGE